MKTKALPLGKRLRQCRGTKPAREIAAVLGVAEQTLTSWERGRAEPGCATLVALAKHYGVSVDWLLGLTNLSGKPQTSADAVQVLSRMLEIEAKAQQERQALLASIIPCQG